MNRFVDIPAEAITARLTAAKFTRTNTAGEVTYELRHARDSRLVVTVYTSVARGAGVARACGDDAIRVLAQLVWVPRGETAPRRKTLYRAKILRVNSVEGTLDRMVEAAREGWRACNRLYTEDYRRRLEKRFGRGPMVDRTVDLVTA